MTSTAPIPRHSTSSSRTGTSAIESAHELEMFRICNDVLLNKCNKCLINTRRTYLMNTACRLRNIIESMGCRRNIGHIVKNRKIRDIRNKWEKKQLTNFGDISLNKTLLLEQIRERMGNATANERHGGWNIASARNTISLTSHSADRHEMWQEEWYQSKIERNKGKRNTSRNASPHISNEKRFRS